MTSKSTDSNMESSSRNMNSTNEVPVSSKVSDVTVKFEDSIMHGDQTKYNNNFTEIVFSNKQEPKGDIDLFEKMFVAWKNQEIDVGTNEKDALQRLDTVKSGCNNTEIKVTDLEKTVDMLHNTIGSLHNELNLVYELGKETDELKDKVKKYDCELVTRQNQIKKITEDFESNIANITQIQEDEIDTLKEQHINTLQITEKDYNAKLHTKKEEINQMKEKIEKIEVDKKSEITLLKIDYENKVAKIQRQKAASSLNQQQSSSSNQEIFRKKLQHIKTEHDLETSELRQQVKTLQDQLEQCNRAVSRDSQFASQGSRGRGQMTHGQSSRGQPIARPYRRETYRGISNTSFASPATKRPRKF